MIHFCEGSESPNESQDDLARSTAASVVRNITGKRRLRKKYKLNRNGFLLVSNLLLNSNFKGSSIHQSMILIHHLTLSGLGGSF